METTNKRNVYPILILPGRLAYLRRPPGLMPKMDPTYGSLNLEWHPSYIPYYKGEETMKQLWLLLFLPVAAMAQTT